MSNLASLFTVIALLAVIFAPQALAIYFSARRKAEREEYATDGR